MSQRCPYSFEKFQWGLETQKSRTWTVKQRLHVGFLPQNILSEYPSWLHVRLLVFPITATIERFKEVWAGATFFWKMVGSTTSLRWSLNTVNSECDELRMQCIPNAMNSECDVFRIRWIMNVMNDVVKGCLFFGKGLKGKNFTSY